MIGCRDIKAFLLGIFLWFAGAILIGFLLTPLYLKGIVIKFNVPIFIFDFVNFLLFQGPYLLLNLFCGILVGLITMRIRGIFIAGIIPVTMIAFFMSIDEYDLLIFSVDKWHITWLWVGFAMIGGYIGKTIKSLYKT